jgi:hypothetical protein
MKHTLVLVLVSSCAALVLSASEPGQITSKRELKAAEASARTPADYERIGYYYRVQAGDFRAKEAEAEQAEAQWSNYYAERTKLPNPYSSARLLASFYESKAQQALNKAAEEVKLAHAAEASPEIMTSRR